MNARAPVAKKRKTCGTTEPIGKKSYVEKLSNCKLVNNGARGKACYSQKRNKAALCAIFTIYSILCHYAVYSRLNAWYASACACIILETAGVCVLMIYYMKRESHYRKMYPIWRLLNILNKFILIFLFPLMLPETVRLSYFSSQYNLFKELLSSRWSIFAICKGLLLSCSRICQTIIAKNRQILKIMFNITVRPLQ